MRSQFKQLLEETINKGITNYMKRLKKFFKKLSSKSSQPTLRDKVVEMYGEEAGEVYDKTTMGIPIGGFLETAMFVYMIENAKKALGEE